MERHIEIKTSAGMIRGMLHDPIKSPSNPQIVVIVHGYFSANRVGPARLYVQIARRLASSGFAVLRCDALGVGDSDGDFSSVTLESEIRDFMAICKYARSLSPEGGLILIGHSMGANLALRLADGGRGVRAALLIAPEVRFRGGIDRLFSEPQKAELRSQGWTIRKGLLVNSSFVRELRSVEPISLATQLEVPFAVIQGTADELYEAEGARELAGANPLANLVLLNGGDHNFLGESRAELLDAVMSHVPRLIAGQPEEST